MIKDLYFIKTKRKFVFFLFILLSFMWSLKLNAQTLRTDSNVPALDACGESGEFKVRIAKGATACNGAFLKIEFPAGTGIEYVAGSAKSGGVSLTESNVSATGATLNLPLISTGTANEEVEITFRARATCEAIATTNLSDDKKPSAKYTFTDCVGPQVGNSEIINIRYAVLKVSVNPTVLQGAVGSTLTRTIKVTNQGNGVIQSFTLERQLGTGLSLVSIAEPAGWTVNVNANKYEYSGKSLLPGESVEVKETIKINTCSNLNSLFEAYYGCTDKCTLGNANGSVSSNVVIDQTSKPQLVATLADPDVNCFNKDYEFVWTIKNNGTAGSSDTQFSFSVGDPVSGYMVNNSVTVGGVAVPDASLTNKSFISQTAFGSQGKMYNFTVKVPDLAPGESVELRYKVNYPLPVADCTKAPASFTRGGMNYSATYKLKEDCSGSGEVLKIPYSQALAYQAYGFSGSNIGEVDAVTNYNADFLITSWNASSYKLEAGAYFDIKIELSPSMQTGFDPSLIKIYNGTKYITPDEVLNDGGGVYRLRIKYGVNPIWPVNTMLNLGSARYRVMFPVAIDCTKGTDAWYKITGELNRGTTCAQVIQFLCTTVAVNSHCGGGPCPTGGMKAGLGVLKRMTYGYLDNNPDDSVPDNPSAPTPLDPDNLPAGIATRFFVGNDVLRISQSGKVLHGTATPAAGWVDGAFTVQSPAELRSAPVANSGRVSITRGGVTYQVLNLPVLQNTNTFSISLDVAQLKALSASLPSDFTFKDDDEIVASLDIRPMEYVAPNGIKAFPVNLSLKVGNTHYTCDGGYTASGFYGRLQAQVLSSLDTQSISSCSFGSDNNIYLRLWVLEASRNNMFPNEFREFMSPKKAILNIPEGLNVIGMRVTLWNNTQNTPGYIAAQDDFATPVSGQIFSYDLTTLTEKLKKGKGLNLDEGFDYYISPIVALNCKSSDKEIIGLKATFNGTFNFNGKDYYDPTEEIVGNNVNLTYNSDNARLTTVVPQPAIVVNGSQAQWIVQMNNTSSFRKFENVWIGQKSASAGANMVSVQKIMSASDHTPVGAPAVQSGDIFQLGDFTTNTSSYYLITADLNSCTSGDLILNFGYNCGGYPGSLVTACAKPESIDLSYTAQVASLQTSIISQLPASTHPKLCEALPYELEVNNAGSGSAKDLTIRIPLTAAGSLKFIPNTLQITPGFTTTVAPYQNAADAQVTVTNTEILVTVPASILAELKGGEKFRIKIDLAPAGCSFKSGQRISFIPSGKNLCGSDVAQISSASSNRVIIDGAFLDEPVLNISTSIEMLNAANTTQIGAKYSFTLKNVGDAINNFPATSNYYFNILLPDGWQLEGNPQDLIPANKATYVGLDPVKGYVFKLAQDLVYQDELKIVDAKIIYTKADANTLACTQAFDIKEGVYAMFKPKSVCAGAECEIEQLIVNHVSTFTLAKPAIPAGDANQTFCEGAKLADIVLTNPNNLAWYETANSTVKLDPTTVLVDGKTYYAANQLIDGATCVSDRFAVTVKIDAQPTANAGPDQVSNFGGTFTMAANAPTAPMTGLWTEVLAQGASPIATITDPTAFNTTVSIASGQQATLRWTISNGDCSAFDDMVITAGHNVDLALKKTADKASYNAGDQLNYTITVTNNGEGTLLQNQVITITETLPVGLINVSFSSTDGTYNGTTGEFTLGADMAKTQSIRLMVQATVAPNFKGSSLLNKASVKTPNGVTDPDLTNNEDEVTTPVKREADIGVNKTADKTVLQPGELITYTILITNHGNATLTSGEVLTLTEELPAGLIDVTYTSQGGTYDPAAHSFTLTADLIKAGTVSLTVKAKLDAAYASTTLANKVSVKTPPDVVDPVPSNNEDEIIVPTILPADLMVLKTSNSSAPIVGTEIVFSIKVKNQGPSAATGVNVMDVLKDGYTYVSSTVSQGTYTAATGVWAIGNLANGAEATLTITAKVKTTGNYNNTATVSGNETDPDPTNNESSITPAPIVSPPIAVDDSDKTKTNTPVTIDIVKNDRPGSSGSPVVPSSVEVVEQPKNGTIQVRPDGTVIYTPNKGYVGTDVFTYRIKDELGNWSNVATVTIIIEPNDLKIPNVFTPNGDGTNDTFEIKGLEAFDNCVITIFNRWGNEVYKNGNYKNNWDGRGLNVGTYYYLIKLTKAGQEQVFKGWVLLKR